MHKIHWSQSNLLTDARWAQHAVLVMSCFSLNCTFTIVKASFITSGRVIVSQDTRSSFFNCRFTFYLAVLVQCFWNCIETSSLIGSRKNRWCHCSIDVTSNHTRSWRCIQAEWRCTSSWPCPSRSMDPGKGCTPCKCHHSDHSQPAAAAGPPLLYQRRGVPAEEKMQFTMYLLIQ